MLANNVLNYVYGTILLWNYHHQHYELWREDGKEIVLDLGEGATVEKKHLKTFSDGIYVLRKSIKWMLLITIMLCCWSLCCEDDDGEGRRAWQLKPLERNP